MESPKKISSAKKSTKSPALTRSNCMNKTVAQLKGTRKYQNLSPKPLKKLDICRGLFPGSGIKTPSPVKINLKGLSSKQCYDHPISTKNLKKTPEFQQLKKKTYVNRSKLCDALTNKDTEKVKPLPKIKGMNANDCYDAFSMKELRSTPEFKRLKVKQFKNKTEACKAVTSEKTLRRRPSLKGLSPSKCFKTYTIKELKALPVYQKLASKSTYTKKAELCEALVKLANSKSPRSPRSRSPKRKTVKSAVTKRKQQK